MNSENEAGTCIFEWSCTGDVRKGGCKDKLQIYKQLGSAVDGLGGCWHGSPRHLLMLMMSLDFRGNSNTNSE